MARFAIVPAKTLVEMDRWDIWDVERLKEDLVRKERYLQQAKVMVVNAKARIVEAEKQREKRGIEIQDL